MDVGVDVSVVVGVVDVVGVVLVSVVVGVVVGVGGPVHAASVGVVVVVALVVGVDVSVVVWPASSQTHSSLGQSSSANPPQLISHAHTSDGHASSVVNASQLVSH